LKKKLDYNKFTVLCPTQSTAYRQRKPMNKFTVKKI